MAAGAATLIAMKRGRGARALCKSKSQFGTEPTFAFAKGP